LNTAQAQSGTARWLAGRFERVKLLGSGASGIVYAAIDHQERRWVALKLRARQPSGNLEVQAETQARLAAEGQQAQALHHPDIVTVFDFGTLADGSSWLAMQLVPGCDLTRYTLRQHLLPEPLVLQIGERLALALAHAHAAGVVHRDIKPANVLAHWPTDTLKIVDFGLSRSANSLTTGTGLILGTPHYMAPELLAGAVPDAASDFYALGAMLFQLLSGRLPFEAQNLGELLQRVSNEAAPDLRQHRPDIPKPLAQTLQALLEPQATRRLSDGKPIAQLLQSLRQAWPPPP